jgi:hypothetical protein
MRQSLNSHAENSRHIRFFSEQQTKLYASCTDFHGFITHFCELPFAGSTIVGAATPFLFGVVFHFGINCVQQNSN